MAEEVKNPLGTKPYLVINKEIDGKNCRFEMEMGINLGAAYDFAFNVLNNIIKLSQDAAQKAEAAKKEEPEKNTEDKKEDK